MSKLGICLAVLMVVGMISPIAAESYTHIDIVATEGLGKAEFLSVTSLSYNATPGLSIMGINLKIPLDSVANYTLTYGNAKTITGSASYTRTNPLYSTRQVGLSNFNSYETFWDAQYGGIDTDVIAYATNSSEYLGLYTYNPDAIGGINIDVFYPVGYVLNDVIITKIDIVFSQPTDVLIVVAPYDTVNKNIQAISTTKSGEENFLRFALGIATSVYDVVTTALYWLKFFFIDNIGMTIALYLSITMAYSALTSKNIFMFFRKFFSDQRKIFEFILSLWRTLVEIVSTFRRIF